MGPMLESVNRLLGELRSADLFVNSAAAGNEGEDNEEAQHVMIVKLLLNSANVGMPDRLHLRLLNATVYALRFVPHSAGRFHILAATTRMFNTSSATVKAQQQRASRAADALSDEKEKLIQEAFRLLSEGCKLVASGSDAKDRIKERLLEERRREDEALVAARKQLSGAFDAEISSATRGLVEQEDALLQLHLSRLIGLANVARGTPKGEQRNIEMMFKALQAHSNDCRAHFTQAIRASTAALRKQLGKSRRD